MKGGYHLASANHSYCSGNLHNDLTFKFDLAEEDCKFLIRKMSKISYNCV